uniref:Uncharacterized protein n=1 Tax=Candidatus Kentrum sp. FW TaxID=2126338 RepID=A0A450TB13_9GAMM|nr:MAG: hypothetical protein BECKFW1821C_GA0114237_100513 [Candidatus Kentron sp. FW]
MEKRVRISPARFCFFLASRTESSIYRFATGFPSSKISASVAFHGNFPGCHFSLREKPCDLINLLHAKDLSLKRDDSL